MPFGPPTPFPETIAVLVTFIGGPLHGEKHQLDSPETTIWHVLANGELVAYARRWPASEQLLNSGTDDRVRAIYAPVGMSDSAYAYMAGLVLNVPGVL